MIRALLTAGFLFAFSLTYAQTCPSNVDFELGNFTNWYLYRGSCCPINTPTTGTSSGRHTITSGSATDPYGGFPIVAPGGGSYSLKLGNSSTGAQAERARYFIRIPSGVNNYSLIFRYAVVFEDPGHVAADQPRFEVKAYDSLTNAIINCSQFNYIATSSLPGFAVSSINSGALYKSWSTASINLSGYAGRTVAIDFASGDCSQGAHFGYGYVDLNCGLFQIAYNACDTASTVSLSAPPGFNTYVWKDSSTWSTVGTGQSVTIARPLTTKTYAVILTPYTGFGCPDTLYTRVTINNLVVNATRDTTVCLGSSRQLNANATASATPITYSWTPSTGLSCTNCANPIATPLTTTTYFVTATDANGCSKSDTVVLTVSNPQVAVVKLNVSCFGGANGTLTASTSGGITPYAYSWNTSPVRTTAAITGLSAGTYVLTMTDNAGCVVRDTSIITQPALLNAVINTKTNVSCNNGSNGNATVSVSGGTAPYTYSWNTTPVQTGATASGIRAGSYIVTVTDSKGCTDTANVTITEPAILNASLAARTNVSCYGGNNGTATVAVTGGTSPYTYSWNTGTPQTTVTATSLPAGSYIVTVTDTLGCTDTAMAVITQPTQINASLASLVNASCFGTNTGSASVSVSGGTSPYTYSWNTSPVQTTASATGLGAGTYIVTVTDTLGCTDTALAVITQPTVLNASIASSVNASCNGGSNGSATVTVTGGTTPYTYSWNTTPVKTTASAIGLAAGSYIATVTDAKGCIDTATIIITQPAVLNASISSKTNVRCYGEQSGSATVVATGGTLPYTYSWNTSPVRTTAYVTFSAGTYIATVTDNNGCSDTAHVIITQPAVLNAGIGSSSNVSCFGGSNGIAAVAVSGGTSPYTYSWNTSPPQSTAIAGSLSAGNYIVTVTDTLGCVDTANITIGQPTVLNASVTSHTDVSCFGGNNGTASANATGGTAPYTYSWNTSPVQTTANATALAAGSYTVTVTDARGCIATASVSIAQPTKVNVSLVSKTNASCNGINNGAATVVATGGTSPYTYWWNTTPAQTGASATSLASGNYIAVATDGMGCTDTLAVVISQPYALTAGISTKTDTRCWGEANGSATVLVNGGTSPYTYSWNTNPVQTTASASGLAAGTYIATVTDASGCNDTALVVIAQPALLNATINTVMNVSCYGGSNGSASVSVTGGTSPYTYSWNTSPVQITASAGTLSAGSYIATVTDNKGCIDTANITITQPAVLNASVTVHTNVSCFGGSNGSATATAIGGTLPYSYSWNTSPVQTTATATALAAGSYSVTVTDANGCTSVTSITIGQPTQLNLTLSSKTNASCNGVNNGTATVAATGGTSPYTYWWNTTPAQTTATATSLAAANYMAVATDSAGCTDTLSVVISQPGALNASVSNIVNVSCNGGANGTATVAATGGTLPYSYSWSTSPVQTTAIASSLSAGTYIATVTDAAGCSDTAVATVQQPAVLSAGISAFANVSCFGGNNGSAAVNATGGNLPYTYSWNTSPVKTTAAVTGLTAGTYQVTVTDAKGCAAIAAVTISQPAMLNASIAAKANVTCNAMNNGTATLTISGGTIPYTYSWNTSPVQTGITATALAAGSYVATVTDANGCTDTAQVVITQPAVLNATINQKLDASCNGYTNGSVTTLASGGTLPYTYSWNTTPVQTGAAATSLAAGSYIVTVTDNEGCTDTAMATIGQPAVLNASIAAKTDVACFSGNNGQATVATTGGTTPYTYSWSTNPVQTGVTANSLRAGAYIVTVTDNKGCTDTAQVAIAQPALLVASVTGKTDTKCNGGSDGSATGVASGGTMPYTYSWNTSPVQTGATATGMPAGFYTFTINDQRGCTATDTVRIEEPVRIKATLEPLAKTCVGLANGSAVVKAVSGGIAPYTYLWNTSPVSTTSLATGLAAGTYSVTITDALGCTANENVTVLNFPQLHLGTMPDTEVCPGTKVQLVASGAKTYSWFTEPTLSCLYCNNPIASPTVNTRYYVVGVDSNNCADTAGTLVAIIQKKKMDVGVDLEICAGDKAQLHAEGGIEYTWFPPEDLDNNKIAAPAAAPAVTTRYTAVIKQNECYTDTLHQNVTVRPMPTIDLGPDMDGVVGASFKLLAKTTNAERIEWLPPSGLSCIDCYNPVAVVDKSIVYKAIVFNGKFCKAEDDIAINVKCDESIVSLPNTFTPNGDGANDRFWPISKGNMKVDRMVVFNRWGEKIFEANGIPVNNPDYGWDGTYKGIALKPDVFVYIIETRCATGERIVIKGDISLIR